MAEEYNIPFDDRKIVDAVKEGDIALFGQLVLKYQERLYRLAFYLLGQMDDALDITQRAFTKALVDIGKFDSCSSFYTWLVSILVNIVRDHYRKKVRDQDTSGYLQQILYNSQAADLLRRQHPSELVENREIINLFWQMVDLLPDEEKLTFLLRHVEGFSYREIANIMGISVNLVRTKLFQAREDIRKLLEPYIEWT